MVPAFFTLLDKFSALGSPLLNFPQPADISTVQCTVVYRTRTEMGVYDGRPQSKFPTRPTASKTFIV